MKDELSFESAHMVLHASELLYKAARKEPLPGQDYLEFWAGIIEEVANRSIESYIESCDESVQNLLPKHTDFFAWKNITKDLL